MFDFYSPYPSHHQGGTQKQRKNG